MLLPSFRRVSPGGSAVAGCTRRSSSLSLSVKPLLLNPDPTMKFAMFVGNVDDFAYSDDENIEDEVIYAKPSFENHPRNNRHSSLSTRPPKSPRSNKSSSLNRNEDWKVEADQTSPSNAKSNLLHPNSGTRPTSSYLKKANAVYENENVGVPSISTKPNARYQFQSPSLSRQSSAFSSYSPQKDTLV